VPLMLGETNEETPSQRCLSPGTDSYVLHQVPVLVGGCLMFTQR